MICTEEEAREKWCPYRIGMPNDNCMTTGCMFWQDHGTYHEEHWFEEAFNDLESQKSHRKAGFKRGHASKYEDDKRLQLYLRDTSRPQGACGVAERDVLVETA